jgi:hypothetical protein
MNKMTKHASEIMKLNFITDQGSNRDTMRCAWRAGAPLFSDRWAFGRFGTDCGLGTRAVAACHGDGPSGRSVSVCVRESDRGCESDGERESDDERESGWVRCGAVT